MWSHHLIYELTADCDVITAWLDVEEAKDFCDARNKQGEISCGTEMEGIFGCQSINKVSMQ